MVYARYIELVHRIAGILDGYSMGFSELSQWCFFRVSDVMVDSDVYFFQWWACTTCTGWWDVMTYWHRNGHSGNGKYGGGWCLSTCGSDEVQKKLHDDWRGHVFLPHSIAGKSHMLMAKSTINDHKWSFSMVAEFGWLWHYPLVK